MSSAVPFAGWLRDHAVPLAHLDPAAPLDDLEPVREIVGTARVVAVGEHSHFVREFGQLRQRMLQFLVQRCGFTVLAFEYGFSEGFPLDAWALDEGADDDLAAQLAGSVPIGLSEPLRWLRQHNRTATRPVQFAGIDVPAAGGSVLPALRPVAEYLRQVDPEAAPAAEAAMDLAKSFAGASAAAAAPAWARLSSAEQDALSANLARLLIRFRAVASLYVERSDQHSYDVALRRLEGASRGDYAFRAMAGLFAGTGLTADTSGRDEYMAGSVEWHLDRCAPGTRVVLVAHNAHVQKTPISFNGQLTGFPMGHYLHRALGDDYFAFALTSTGGHTAEMRRDENARFGFVLDDTELGEPEPGSVEADFAEAGTGLSVADLRRARREVPAGPRSIRLQSTHLPAPVLDAFDGIVHTPIATPVRDLVL